MDRFTKGFITSASINTRLFLQSTNLRGQLGLIVCTGTFLWGWHLLAFVSLGVVVYVYFHSNEGRFAGDRKKTDAAVASSFVPLARRKSH